MLDLVAVIGSGGHDPAAEGLADEVGAAIARAGFGLVCGGLGGVMAAACRGARRVHGDVPGAPIIGLLPGTDRGEANPWVEVVIPTGLGYARNVLVVLAADAVIAIGGASGTLSEIAHAWQFGKPICAVGAAGGWARELAGRPIDRKRRDIIHAAATAADVEAWLERLATASR